MSKFQISKVIVFSGSNCKLSESKYDYIIEIEDTVSGDIYDSSVEDFFELAKVIKTFADELKAEEKSKIQEHIRALEERLAASKKLLAELD